MWMYIVPSGCCHRHLSYGLGSLRDDSALQSPPFPPEVLDSDEAIALVLALDDSAHVEAEAPQAPQAPQAPVERPRDFRAEARFRAQARRRDEEDMRLGLIRFFSHFFSKYWLVMLK